MTQPLQSGQKSLHVPDVVKQIRQDDDVERAGQLREVVRVSRHELQIGVTLACLRDHFRREVDAHALRRFERGQQIAFGAAQFEHAQPRRYEEPIDA